MHGSEAASDGKLQGSGKRQEGFEAQTAFPGQGKELCGDGPLVFLDEDKVSQLSQRLQPPPRCPSPPPVCQLLSPARALFSTSLFLGDETATQPLPARHSDLVCPLSVS